MTDTLTLVIWGRKFTLPIIYDSLSDGIISPKQKEAVANFKKHLDWIDTSRCKVEDYCRNSVLEDEDNKKKDNIFSYVKPERLFVERVKRDGKYPQIAIMCKYRYDPEHGLAVVFSYEGIITVGIQDLIL